MSPLYLHGEQLLFHRASMLCCYTEVELNFPGPLAVRERSLAAFTEKANGALG